MLSSLGRQTAMNPTDNVGHSADGGGTEMKGLMGKSLELTPCPWGQRQHKGVSWQGRLVGKRSYGGPILPDPNASVPM